MVSATRVSGVGGAALNLILVLAVMLSLTVVAGQAVAQDTDPLAGETATIAGTDVEDIPDTVTIAVVGCTVDSDTTEVSVVIEDPDGTQITLTNDDNVDITATDDGISITATGTGDNIEGGTPASGDPPTFDPGQGTVIESTGITCNDDGQDDDGQDDDAGSDNCSGAEEVANIGPETESQQETFSITGDSFRVIYDVTINDDSGFVDINVLNEDGLTEASEFIDSTDTGQLVVLEGPGDFEVKVEDVTGDVEYTVTVEDCVGTSDDSGGDNDDGNDDGNDDDGDADDDGVIDDTVPDKDLPNTGGFPLIAAGGVALLSACGVLAAWRSKARER